MACLTCQSKWLTYTALAGQKTSCMIPLPICCDGRFSAARMLTFVLFWQELRQETCKITEKLCHFCNK
jgi:hypothetical protein